MWACRFSPSGVICGSLPLGGSTICDVLRPAVPRSNQNWLYVPGLPGGGFWSTRDRAFRSAISSSVKNSRSPNSWAAPAASASHTTRCPADRGLPRVSWPSTSTARAPARPAAAPGGSPPDQLRPPTAGRERPVTYCDDPSWGASPRSGDYRRCPPTVQLQQLHHLQQLLQGKVSAISSGTGSPPTVTAMYCRPSTSRSSARRCAAPGRSTDASSFPVALS